MKTNNYISEREYKLLLITSFASFLFVASIFVLHAVQNINCTNSGFSGCHRKIVMPGLHIFTLFIFFALLKTKRFLLSSSLNLLYAVFFIFGLYTRFGLPLLEEDFVPEVSFFARIYRAAEYFDYLSGLFISILLFWQISILLRMLFKNTRKINLLP